MSIDQAKLDRIKASLASDAKAEGVTPGPWNSMGGSGLSIQAEDGWEVAFAKNGTDDMQPNPSTRNAAFIARARTTAPAMAKLLLDEILWLERMMRGDEDYEITFGLFHDRLASIVNGWPEGTL